MSLQIKELSIKDYENVIEVTDSSNGLHAFIAIHDSTLGPSMGGIRMLPYSSREEALEDVLRLSKGMTYKNAISGLPHGGGKATFILDPSKPKSREMLHSFAEAVNHLDGNYICAEDMGCTLDDVSTIHEVTNYVTGLPGQGSGDPARFTAWGVYKGIQAVSFRLWGTTCLKGKKIAFQGIGGVGSKLLERLFWEEAILYIADYDNEKLKWAAHEYGATIIDPEEIYDIDCDIFAPCARGKTLNKDTIARLKCPAVAGAANNQLETPEDGKRLQQKGILYAPDYLLNAGGVISCASPYSPVGPEQIHVVKKTNKIFDKLLEVFELAEQKEVCPSVAADELVQSLIKSKKEKNNASV